MWRTNPKPDPEPTPVPATAADPVDAPPPVEESEPVPGMGDAPAWIVATQKELARACGVSITTVQNWRNRGCPVLDDGTFNLFEVAKWKARREYEQHLKRAVASREGDEMMIESSESPALEAYRWQKAILAGFDVEERRRTMVRVSDAQEVFMIVARVLRSAHEIIQRQFGQEAHAILQDALQDASIEFFNRFPMTEPVDETETIQP